MSENIILLFILGLMEGTEELNHPWCVFECGFMFEYLDLHAPSPIYYLVDVDSGLDLGLQELKLGDPTPKLIGWESCKTDMDLDLFLKFL